MTQNASIYDDLPVIANLNYFAKVIGADPDQVKHVIDRTDLGSVARSMAADLSGGS
jgi:ABC-2 type transport system ATP-binding protein